MDLNVPLCKAYLRYIFLKCVLSLTIVFLIHAAKVTGKSVKPRLQSALPHSKLKSNFRVVLN